MNVSTTVPKWLDDAIKKLAQVSGVSRNAYVRALIEDAALRHLTVKEETTVKYHIKPKATTTAPAADQYAKDYCHACNAAQKRRAKPKD